MKAIRFDREEPYIRQFISLPQRLYSQAEIVQSPKEEEQLLRGTHYLNHYVKLTPFLVLEKGRALARCLVTEYPEDQVCYFGYFECVKDEKVFACLMDAVERFAMDSQYPAIEGPLDVSLWIRYRFKANLFDQPPYLGEPYNKDYYLPFFAGRGYAVKERYVSNRYRALPKEGFALPAYRERWEKFAAMGYEIRSPRPEEWDRCVGEIYDMIAVLYRGFLTYHAITREEFAAAYSSYRGLVDYDIIKLAYYHGEAVGFFMGAPDYGNLASRRKTPGTVLRFLRTKKKPERYVLLYMGVMPEHRGAGMALTHCIMEELAQKGTPSIGSLIRSGNPNYDYAAEYMDGRYEYEYLERRFTIADYLRRGEELWGDGEYIAEKTASGWNWHGFAGFAADARRCARWLRERGFGGKKIALYGKNCYGWMVLDIAVMGYAGVCFPVDAQYREREVRNILSASGVSLMLYGREQAEIVDALRGDFPEVSFLSMEQAAEEYASYSGEDGLAAAPPEQTAKVLYTSGTSAVPKGVMLSQANLFANWKALYRRTPMARGDSIYLVLPLNHVYAGVAAFLYTIVSGMKIYLGTPQPGPCMEDFAALHPSVFIGVPLLAEKMWEIAQATGDPAGAFGGKLSYFYCGGTAIRPELKKAYIEAGIPFLEAYGLTETSSVVALDRIGDYREGSAGVLMESVEAVIDSPDENGVGELLVRGKSRMAGYYGLPEVNRRVLDEKGFFHTGDLARIDESRHLYLMGRRRQLLLTSNGKNVYPQEVEERACLCPQVNRATLYEENDRLHLKVWYAGERQPVEEFLERLREELPKYMRYETFECVEDVDGGRLK
ncbi:MAG: AMP-binding protein [Oscillospiraceae bacterium]|nr:AMP-binding protein [Oscillospiraceae bacterium]